MLYLHSNQQDNREQGCKHNLEVAHIISPQISFTVSKSYLPTKDTGKYSFSFKSLELSSESEFLLLKKEGENEYRGWESTVFAIRMRGWMDKKKGKHLKRLGLMYS
jgi:hypothetical protein